MTTERIDRARAGHRSPGELPKGPNGRALCRWCQIEVPRGRQTFCSQHCVDEHVIRTNPTQVRRLLQARDHEVCRVCGRDCAALRAELRRVTDRDERRDRLIAAGWTAREAMAGVAGRTLWDADHTVPVVEGGGGCGLDGYRSLCVPCHREASAALRARLSQRGPR